MGSQWTRIPIPACVAEDGGNSETDPNVCTVGYGDEDLDPVGSVDFWPAVSGSGTFSTDPDPDPTGNNGFIKLFLF